MDELPHDAKEHKRIADQLKAESCSPTLIINPKGQRKYTVPNLIKRIMISNALGIYIEESDRRYFCLKVSNKHVGDTEYFKRFIDCTEQPDSGSLFLTYCHLFNQEHNNFNHMPAPPMTPLKKELIRKSSSSPLRFLIDIKDGEYDLNTIESLTSSGRIKRKDLYDHYKLWCDDAGEKRFRKHLFNEIVSSRLKTVKVRGNLCYKLDLPPIAD